MNATIEDWKNGWIGLDIAVTTKEIDRLIVLLQKLKSDHDQHFHISSDYKNSGGLGEITISIKDIEQKNNLFLSGLALMPGDEI